MPHILVLDGSLRPGSGNTARALDLACSTWEGAATVERVALGAFEGSIEEMAARIRAADGLLVGTGTYWSSWGSPLQRFLEAMTGYEATDVFVGKPVSVLVTMDSTGGSEVAARLVSVFTCLGCFTPPFGWLVLSRVGVALASRDPEATRDVWGAPDVRILAENLRIASGASRPSFHAWTIEKSETATGSLSGSIRVPPAAPDF
jgi:NAD(P)H-dependent FMN reductase